MPSIEEDEENHYDNEDLEDDEDEDEDEDEDVDDEEEGDLESDDEIDEDDDETDHQQPMKQEQPHHPPPTPTLPPPAADSPPPTPTPPQPPIPPPEEKKPLAIDDSRRLFQRLWTDEDEIGLLQGFYEYTSQRGGFKNSAYHHDTAPFYDQIKSRLQLDFNKNQLVEKLRRLKKKYRNVMSRINSGKDLSFKTPHDQATFEISRKIWVDIGGGGVDDEDHTTSVHPHGNDTAQVNGIKAIPPPPVFASSSRKRPRTATIPVPTPTPIPVTTVGPEENVSIHTNLLNSSVNSSLQHNVIEETVKSCLGPLFKELMHSAVNGRSFVGLGLNPLPMSFVGGAREREMMDEKWRKQQILELEVYSKRVELVQEQIQVALEELKSNGNQ